MILSPPGSSSRPGGPYRKPRADLYTVLLVLALIAIMLCVLCLYFEMQMYEFQFKGFKGAPSARADHRTALAMAGDQRPVAPGHARGDAPPLNISDP